MNCKRCGSLLTENDQFCKNCGAPVENLSAQNNVVNNQQPQAFVQNEYNQMQQPVSNIQPNIATQPVQPAPINNVEQTPTIQPNPVPAVNPVQTPNTNANMQQPINPVSYTTEKKSSKSLGIVIGIIIAGIIIAAAVIFVLGGKGGSIGSTKTYTVIHDGFTYKIPTNLIYSTDEDYLILGNEEDTWAVLIATLEGSYSQYVAGKNQLILKFQSDGYAINDLSERNIGGVTFLVGEASKSGNNAIIAYSKANSMYTFGMIVTTINNDFDYDVLKNITSVLKSAEMGISTNSISTFDTIDLKKLD